MPFKYKKTSCLNDSKQDVFYYKVKRLFKILHRISFDRRIVDLKRFRFS